MITFGGVAQMTTQAAMAGIKSDSSMTGMQTDKSSMAPQSREEMEAMAIGKVAEANIIKPKAEKDEGMSMPQAGLKRETYNAMGQLGQMTAMKRAGVNINKSI